MESLFSWLTNNYIEVFGTISGLIFLYLEIKESVWLWPLGIITSATYIYVFFVSKFYADMGLQVYYVVISIYGWIYWLRGNKRESDNKLQICRIKKNESILSAISFLVLFVLIYFILFRYTDSPVPIGDSFTTALSIVATWMLARKILEQWLLWIVINAVSLGLYIYKGLYPTSILFVFYTILAIVGYYKWKSEFNKQSNCD